MNDVRWDEVPTLFGTRPQERVYALRSDEHGKAYVQFGDGDRGARLPTGSNNVRAKYRKGIGAGGNVKPDALAQLLDRPLGVKGVSNPLAASGGVDPETEDAARRIDPARRAHARARRLAARLRGLRARVHRCRQGERHGAPAPRRAHDRRHRRLRGRRAARRSRGRRSRATATRACRCSCSRGRRRRSGSR